MNTVNIFHLSPLKKSVTAHETLADLLHINPVLKYMRYNTSVQHLLLFTDSLNSHSAMKFQSCLCEMSLFL